MRSGWKEVTLGDIFDISSSKRVLQKQWQSEGVPFYRAREIVKLSLFGKVENELFISEELFEEFKAKYGAPKPGDLMVSAVGTLGACYVVQPGDRFYYKDASVLRFSPKAPVDSRYIQRAFGTAHIINQINSGSGSTVGTYTISRAQKTTIPLPPLAEQKRIAAILDAADGLRAKRRESLAQLDTLLQSTFLDMFGDVESSSTTTLKNVCSLITDGTHQTPTYSDEGIIFLSSKNVKTGEIDWENIKFIPHSLHKELHKRLSPQRNDILLAKNGTTGTAAIVDRDEVFDIYVSLALMRPKDTIHPVYLLYAINSDQTAFQFNRSLKGVGVPNLHLTEIRKATIPLPPLKLQHRFATIVKSVGKQKAKLRQHLAELDALFASLQQRAFNGEL